MNKPVFNPHPFYVDLFGYLLVLISLCLIVTWSLEKVATEFFRFW